MSRFEVLNGVRGAGTVVGILDARLDFGQCLARSGAEVVIETDTLGLPTFRLSDKGAGDGTGKSSGAGGPGSCRERQPVVDYSAVTAFARTCGSPTSISDACVQAYYARATSNRLPPRVRVSLREPAGVGTDLAVAPTLGVAFGVTLAAIAAGAFFARGVLRPVQDLTRASRGLGEGDLSLRVGVHGKGEVADLARSFNRMAASLQRSEQRQRQLIGDIAHELRTPLANLRGYLEALQDGYLEPTPDLLGSLHEEVVLQQRIVEDLQQLTLAEAGALSYDWQTVDVPELLAGCVTGHAAQAAAAGTVLVHEDDASGGPLLVRGDPARLRQVIGNLLNNALRATADSRGEGVRVSSYREGDRVRIRVRDDGIGISEEQLPHVFDRFWRGDPARGRATGGSGLGLAIVRQIVLDHSGIVEVSALLGQGAEFTVVLPAAAQASPLQVSQAGPGSCTDRGTGHSTGEGAGQAVTPG